MSINNLLFSVQNMSPAMLNVGAGKTQNYSNLAELSSGLWGDTSSSSTSGLGSSGATDTVSLTYKNIGDKMVNDMASVTAGVIKQYPNLDGDYVIAIVDDGQTREARVYRRSEILDNFEGSEAEKAQLKAQLDKNPLMVFSSASGLPDSAEDAGCQQLVKKLNEFLTTNAKTLNVLDKAGFDPLADMLGSSSMKKILANFARSVEEEAAKPENKTPAADEEKDEESSGEDDSEED